MTGLDPPWIYPSQSFSQLVSPENWHPQKMGKSEIPALEKKPHAFLSEAFKFNFRGVAASPLSVAEAKVDPHVKRSMPEGLDPKDGETARELAEK